MAKVGRPTDFRLEFIDQAKKLCRLGATDMDLADFFEVDESTITRWKKAHPEFCTSLKEGKMLADAEVADSLYHRAKGYEHEAVKMFLVDGQVIEHTYIERYPPDTTACIFWLKNRKPDVWREKSVVQQVGNDVAIEAKVAQLVRELSEEP